MLTICLLIPKLDLNSCSGMSLNLFHKCFFSLPFLCSSCLVVLYRFIALLYLLPSRTPPRERVVIFANTANPCSNISDDAHLHRILYPCVVPAKLNRNSRRHHCQIRILVAKIVPSGPLSRQSGNLCSISWLVCQSASCARYLLISIPPSLDSLLTASSGDDAI